MRFRKKSHSTKRQVIWGKDAHHTSWIHPNNKETLLLAWELRNSTSRLPRRGRGRRWWRQRRGGCPSGDRIRLHHCDLWGYIEEIRIGQIEFRMGGCLCTWWLLKLAIRDICDNKQKHAPVSLASSRRAGSQQGKKTKKKSDVEPTWLARRMPQRRPDPAPSLRSGGQGRGHPHRCDLVACWRRLNSMSGAWTSAGERGTRAWCCGGLSWWMRRQRKGTQGRHRPQSRGWRIGPWLSSPRPPSWRLGGDRGAPSILFAKIWYAAAPAGTGLLREKRWTWSARQRTSLGGEGLASGGPTAGRAWEEGRGICCRSLMHGELIRRK
jgi:hypothetical protein